MQRPTEWKCGTTTPTAFEITCFTALPIESTIDPYFNTVRKQHEYIFSIGPNFLVPCLSLPDRISVANWPTIFEKDLLRRCLTMRKRTGGTE